MGFQSFMKKAGKTALIKGLPCIDPTGLTRQAAELTDKMTESTDYGKFLQLAEILGDLKAINDIYEASMADDGKLDAEELHLIIDAVQELHRDAEAVRERFF